MDIRITPTALEGLLLVDVKAVEDHRGFFIESWNRAEFAKHGLALDFVQDNHSRSAHGVLRGLHYQDMRAPQTKLVRCTSGAIWDVAVDLRVSSATFGQWYGAELSAANKRQLLIPAGFGHGFVAVTEFAELQYKCTDYYCPEAEGVVHWADPDLAIAWPVAQPTLSARDQLGMSLKAYREHPAFH